MSDLSSLSNLVKGGRRDISARCTDALKCKGGTCAEVERYNGTDVDKYAAEGLESYGSTILHLVT